jgi:ABC-type polysaccharide transport system, permease component
MAKVIAKGSGLSIVKKKETFVLLFLCLPAILLLLIFNYLPMAGLLMAFQKLDYSVPFLRGAWVGTKNFNFLFQSNEMFILVRNTILYNLAFIVTMNIGGVFLGLILNEITKKSYVKLYQSILLFPNFVSWVTVSIIVAGLIHPKLGMINGILHSMGMQPIDMYAHPKLWPLLIILANMWKGLGYSCLIYYANIIGIDKELYEAATIDGATKLQQIRNIAIPCITPMITFFVLLALGAIFSANFDMFFNLTSQTSGNVLGAVGADDYVKVLDVRVFGYLRVTGDTATASAIGFTQSIVGFIIVICSNLLVRKINKENALF